MVTVVCVVLNLVSTVFILAFAVDDITWHLMCYKIDILGWHQEQDQWSSVKVN